MPNDSNVGRAPEQGLPDAAKIAALLRSWRAIGETENWGEPQLHADTSDAIEALERPRPALPDLHEIFVQPRFQKALRALYVGIGRSGSYEREIALIQAVVGAALPPQTGNPPPSAFERKHGIPWEIIAKDGLVWVESSRGRIECDSLLDGERTADALKRLDRGEVWRGNL